MTEIKTGPASEPLFEKTRPMLMGLAYRILGSHHDAEDVVQDVYEIWLTRADPEAIKKPENWLALACSRRAIDRLRAQKRQRETYPGDWLPEPVWTDDKSDAEHQLLLSESLTTAFLMVLDKLNPKERAAYLLRDIFHTDYEDIASALNMEQPACRQLVSRARKRLKQEGTPAAPPPAQQKQLVGAFHQAIQQGNLEDLKALLAQDVTLYADSGGKAAAISKPVFGFKAVGKFFQTVLFPIWDQQGGELKAMHLNGQPGLLHYHEGELTTAISFAFDDQNHATGIYMMRNPDKLARLDRLFPLSEG